MKLEEQERLEKSAESLRQALARVAR